MIALPEESVLRVGKEVPRVQCRVDHLIDFVVVRALFDDQDGKTRIGFCQSASNHAAGETTCKSLVSLDVPIVDRTGGGTYLLRR